MSNLWPDSDTWNLSYLPDVYGPLFDGGSVKQAVIQTLELWLPSYIAEINRQLGSLVLAVPNTYLYRDDERPIAANTAQVTVSVPRTIGAPQRTTTTYRTTFHVEVRTFFAGRQDWNLSEAIAHAYGAAVKAAIGQHPTLTPTGQPNFAEATVWTGYQLGASKRSATYYRVVRLDSFSVVLSNVMSPYGGPPSPSTAPPASIVEVSQTDVVVDAVPITQPV